MMTQNPMNNLISNPFYQMALAMSKGKNDQELKQIALNICKEKGINFDEAYKSFQQYFKGTNVPLT